MPKRRRHPLNFDDVVALPANSKALVESYTQIRADFAGLKSDFGAAVTSMQADVRRLNSSVETGFVPGAIVPVGGGIQTQISKEKLARVAELIADPRLQDIISLLSRRRAEIERVAAAQRIAKKFGKSAIHKTRRTVIRSELMRDAETHNRTEAREFEERVVSNLIGAVEVIRQADGNLDSIYRQINSFLNRLVTADLAGPHWWRKQPKTEKELKKIPIREIELDEETLDPAFLRQTNLLADIETRLLFEHLPTLAKLTKREKEVFHRSTVDAMPDEEIALELKMNPSTVRVHLFNARQKIRKIW